MSVVRWDFNDLTFSSSCYHPKVSSRYTQVRFGRLQLLHSHTTPKTKPRDSVNRCLSDWVRKNVSTAEAHINEKSRWKSEGSSQISYQNIYSMCCKRNGVMGVVFVWARLGYSQFQASHFRPPIFCARPKKCGCVCITVALEAVWLQSMCNSIHIQAAAQERAHEKSDWNSIN